MSSTALQIIFLFSLLIATAVLGQGVIGRTDTIVSGGHRIDANTDGVLSVMPKSLHDDLVLWQMFSYSDNSDANYYDLSAGGNDGTQSTASSQPSHQTANGGYYDFDGVDDLIDLPDTPFDFERTDPFAFAMWVNMDNFTGYPYLLGKQINAAPYRGIAWFFYTTGALALNLQNDNSGNVLSRILTTETISADEWHHVAAISQGVDGSVSDLSIYIDGEHANASTVLDGLGANTILNNVGMQIGARSNASKLVNGSLDDVRIYNVAITSNDVLSIALAGAATYYPYFSTDDYGFPEYMDLALWLPFDSDETPDYIDKGPLGNDGSQATASSQPTFSSSNGGVYDFDKVDDYIDIAHSASINFDNDDAFSIVTWVKQDAARIGSSGQMYAKYDGTTGYLNYLSSDKLSLFLQQTVGSRLFVQSTATFTDTNTWYNFASTYDGSSAASGVTLYAQGAVTADSHTSDTLAGSIVNSVSGNIGAFGGSSHLWSGLISEVRIYDRVLTAAEVLAIYNNTKATYGL